MHALENFRKKSVEADLSNPYPDWLIGVNPPHIASKLLPLGKGDRQRRRSFGDRLAIEIAQYNTTHDKIADQYARLTGRFEDTQMELLRPSIREVAFRKAIGDFISENAMGEDARVPLLNILVINDNAETQETHDTESPFEIGQYGDIDFLGPLYDAKARSLCRIAYGLNRNFSEITGDTILPCTGEEQKGYDLILVYNDNPNRNIAHYPHLGTTEFANILVDLLNPFGRIVTSAVPSLTPLRAAFVANEESEGLAIQRYEDTLFINMAYPYVAYVPDSDSDNTHRPVLSIGRNPVECDGGITIARSASSAETDEPLTVLPLETDSNHIRLPRARLLIMGGFGLGVAAAATGVSIYVATSSPEEPSCPDSTVALTPTIESAGTTVFSLDGGKVIVNITGNREIVIMPDLSVKNVQTQPWNVPFGNTTIDVYPKNDDEALGCLVPAKNTKTPAEQSSTTHSSANAPSTGAN